MASQQTLDQLHQQIAAVIASGRQAAYRAVNVEMIQTYWQIGRIIVEEEQAGQERAQYGDYLIRNLAGRLSQDFGKGFDERNLRHMRAFYTTYPIRNALRTELTWTHYRLLLKVPSEAARRFYEDETVKSGWSTRALERQINAFYYERLLASQDKAGVQAEATEKTAPLAPTPRDFIKDPYVLEFLEASANPTLYERNLEGQLINNLQQFLLELGRGFAFVARQKHITVEGDSFYVDLVLYNYLLKCFVLIDLKVGKLAHQDIGQMQMYVRLYDELYKVPGDMPTIGLILCSEKNETVVKYALPADNQQIFASKYMLYLPTEDELRAQLNRERHFADLDLRNSLDPNLPA